MYPLRRAPHTDNRLHACPCWISMVEAQNVGVSKDLLRGRAVLFFAVLIELYHSISDRCSAYL